MQKSSADGFRGSSIHGTVDKLMHNLVERRKILFQNETNYNTVEYEKNSEREVNHDLINYQGSHLLSSSEIFAKEKTRVTETIGEPPSLADYSNDQEDFTINIDYKSLSSQIVQRYENLHELQNNDEDSLNSHQCKWKLLNVLAGSHTGWIRSLCVEPDNEWFASGSVDSTIKVWDLASTQLKVTLTGHIMAVRGLVVSDRHPYMFSCSEDKTVKCWDLEKNAIIRDYYGHFSAVYSIDIHPTLDLIVTGGRDSSVRLWDIRSKTCVHTMTGHTSNVLNVKTRPVDPQIISTSSDKTIRLWDIVAGKTIDILTNHSKGVRSLALSPFENSFVTGSTDELKKWALPQGAFIEDFSLSNKEDLATSTKIVNTLSVNPEGVLFSGSDEGDMNFFDYKLKKNFQNLKTTRLPGSLESENGILCSTFDKSGMRLITGEADKTIKIWGEIS